MTDDDIIAIRKATRAANTAIPWADSLAFARAIEAAVIDRISVKFAGRVDLPLPERASKK